MTKSINYKYRFEEILGCDVDTFEYLLQDNQEVKELRLDLIDIILEYFKSDNLSSREKQIITLYLNSTPLTEISGAIGLSVTRVKEIVYGGKRNLGIVGRAKKYFKDNPDVQHIIHKIKDIQNNQIF